MNTANITYQYAPARTPAERLAMRVADVDRAVTAGLSADDIEARKEVCENAIYRAVRADSSLAVRGAFEASRLGLDMDATATRFESFDRMDAEGRS